MESIIIKGSSLTMRSNECALLTQWVEITPFALKVFIESRMANPDEKIDYDKENECSLCMDVLYEELGKKSFAEIAQEQMIMLKAKI
jgi:hypothetical protein